MEETNETAIVKSKDDRLIPIEKKKIETVGEGIVSIIQETGTVEFTEKQKEILFAPVNEEIIEIRPDGLIYLPWMEYVSRLRDAFGGKWAIIPGTNKPEKGPEGTSLLWGFYLFIDGKPYGYAIGEQEYYPNNPRMSWGDACEGAKSNALMRLCKGIGIGLELWRPSFIKGWKANHAKKHQDIDKYGKTKTYWGKKEIEANEQAIREPKEEKKAKGKKKANLDVEMHSLEQMGMFLDEETYLVDLGYERELLRAELKRKFGIEDIDDMTKEQIEKAIDFFKKTASFKRAKDENRSS